MNPLKELIKGEALSFWNDQFYVEHEPVRFQVRSRFRRFGKITRQGLACFRLQLQLLAVTKNQAPETIPFGLVLPARALGNLLNEQSFHGRERAFDRQTHSKL